MRRIVAFLGVALGAGVAFGGAPPTAAPTDVKVVLQEVVDDRISEGLATGGLRLVLGLEGKGLDAVTSARVLVKQAKDETGRNLLPADAAPPDFTDRNVNGGRIPVSLLNPPRSASSVQLAGAVELFVPRRDPGAVVRVEKALAHVDAPLESKGLKAAKVEVTILSKARYLAERKKMRLTESKVAEIRAEGKKRGMKADEIEALVEMAKAIDEMGESDVLEGVLFLFLPKAGADKVQSIRLETPEGKEIETRGSSARSDGEVVLRQIEPTAPLPADTVLVFTLFTETSKVSVPFELKEVPLP